MSLPASAACTWDSPHLVNIPHPLEVCVLLAPTTSPHRCHHVFRKLHFSGVGLAPALGLLESLPGIFHDGPGEASAGPLHSAGSRRVKVGAPGFQAFCRAEELACRGRIKSCAKRSRDERWREKVLVPVVLRSSCVLSFLRLII